MKRRAIKISMAMERGEVAETPEIAEAEMLARNCRMQKCQKAQMPEIAECGNARKPKCQKAEM